MKSTDFAYGKRQEAASSGLGLFVSIQKRDGQTHYEMRRQPHGDVCVGPLKKGDPALFSLEPKALDDAWDWLED